MAWRGRWPARDWLLLPLIAFFTFAMLAVPTEWLFRTAYPQVLVDTCIQSSVNQPYARARPNCVSRVKAAEGPWSTNSYNSCGYRTPEGCGPKPPDAIRFAVVGSSTGAGYLTQYPETMAARTARALRRACKRPVEFQNLGVAGEQNTKLLARTREALALRPDAILVVISPFDFELAPGDDAFRAGDRNLFRRAKAAVRQSRILYMGSYAMLRDDGSYLPVYLGSGENPAFMRMPLDARWRGKLAGFEASINRVEALVAAAHVPTWLVFVPQRAQAALIASGQIPTNVHPHQLPDLLRGIAKRHQLGFVDSSAAIPPRIESTELFYAVNGHINAGGHAMVARALLHRLALDRPAFLDGCDL